MKKLLLFTLIAATITPMPAEAAWRRAAQFGVGLAVGIGTKVIHCLEYGLDGEVYAAGGEQYYPTGIIGSTERVHFGCGDREDMRCGATHSPAVAPENPTSGFEDEPLPRARRYRYPTVIVLEDPNSLRELLCAPEAMAALEALTITEGLRIFLADNCAGFVNLKRLSIRCRSYTPEEALAVYLLQQRLGLECVCFEHYESHH